MLSFFEEYIIVFHAPSQFPKNRDASNTILDYSKSSYLYFIFIIYIVSFNQNTMFPTFVGPCSIPLIQTKGQSSYKSSAKGPPLAWCQHPLSAQNDRHIWLLSEICEKNIHISLSLYIYVNIYICKYIYTYLSRYTYKS
jgi:hypothetical protein